MLPEWIRLKNPSKNRRFKKIERLSEPKALTIGSASHSFECQIHSQATLKISIPKCSYVKKV